MTAIVDNNLPISLTRWMDADQDEVAVRHVVDLGLQDETDDALRSRWHNDSIIWVTRDQDFWLDAPDPWAVVWIDCHNPLPQSASCFPARYRGPRCSWMAAAVAAWRPAAHNGVVDRAGVEAGRSVTRCTPRRDGGRTQPSDSLDRPSACPHSVLGG